MIVYRTYSGWTFDCAGFLKSRSLTARETIETLGSKEPSYQYHE